MIVRTSLAPIPETLNNIAYVAQGKPIRIGFEGKDTYLEADVDGYYLLHRSDLEALIRELMER